MARINIEDSIYKDIRFTKLLLKCGSLDSALGALLRAWSLAQRYYLTETRMIPISEWNRQEINNAIIDVGLAEKIGEFIRICGADNQFSWLLQKSEAGKKTKKRTLTNDQRTLTNDHRVESSSSSSSSFSYKEVEEEEAEICKSEKSRAKNLSIKDFDDRFKFNSEIKRIESGLDKMFDGHAPPSLRRRALKILNSCDKNVETVSKTLSDIYSSTKCDRDKNPDWRKYLAVSIKKEFGLNE
jgi:hypothetical protein